MANIKKQFNKTIATYTDTKGEVYKKDTHFSKVKLSKLASAEVESRGKMDFTIELKEVKEVREMTPEFFYDNSTPVVVAEEDVEKKEEENTEKEGN